MSANPKSAALVGRKKIGQRKERSDAALGHESQNKSSPEVARQRDELPTEWKLVRLGDIAQTTSGGTPRRDTANYYGGNIPWVKSGELGDRVVYETNESLTDEGLASSSAKVFPKGTLCIALYGATVGKLGILGIEAATNQAVCAVFPPEDIDTRYLYRFFEGKRRQLIEQGKGGAQSNISQGIIRDTLLPLPSLPEQRRIVAEIDKQFTRLEAGVAALRRVQANLKRYRSAVLKAACEGRLVPTEAELAKNGNRKSKFETGEELLARILTERRQNWQGRGKYIEPAAPDTTNLPVLPNGWTYISVEAGGFVQLGRQRAPQHHTGANMRPYLRVANVFEDRIDLSDVKTMNFTPAEFETFRLEPNDILLNEGQSLELVGRPALYRGELPGACFTNTLVRFRPCPSLDVRFALSVFRSFMHSGRFQKIAKWTTNIAHLGADRFAKLAFPLPPLAEQTRIVAEVERRLSVVYELESVVSENLQRATRLRQSILQKAFSGNL